MSIHEARRKRLRQQLRAAKLDGLLVTNFVNVTYLTGFTGDDSYLVVTLDGERLVTDMRYTTQLEDECPALTLHVREPGDKMTEATAKVLKSAKADKVGVEAGSMTVGLFNELQKQAPKSKLEAADDLVENLRAFKDKEEVASIRVACRHAKQAFQAVRATVTPAMTESEVAAELEYQARRFGAKGLSFEPIVAVGARSALPHGRPTDVALRASDFTLVDWGARTGLYVSDLTRMWVTGRISPKFRKIYEVVLAAQLAGIDAIRPGVKCEEVDAVARGVITKAGYGKQFGHGLGHGIGLEIHEAPRLTKQQEVELQPGMVVTVEPGVYFPGWGGIRIEDDVLVTLSGHEVLSDVPKQLDDCVLS
jgi:Xaa-Pro aminopeptidase